MNAPHLSLRRSTRGFSLVELMVSITVLLLALSCITQMFNSAVVATGGGYKRMDADTQARMVLDRIAFDISRIVKRTDIDYYFQKNTGSSTLPGNDQMAFYSETSGYYPSGVTDSTKVSNQSLVGYRINSSNQLERLNKALVWNGVTASDSPMVFLPQTLLGTWPGIAPTGSGTADSSYQVIGDQVFRLEFSYLVQNSTNNAQLSDKPYLAPSTAINGMQDVVAIVVDIAVLDAKSRAILNSTALQNAAVNLPDVSGTTISGNALPASTWKAKITSNSLGLPASANAQVRVYQRYCYLTPVP